MFSRRIPTDLRPNLITQARRRLGTPPFDLTVSNPTSCGIPYPEDLLAPLADPAGLRYRPDPRGLRSTREAIAAEYGRGGARVDPNRVVLTASTSEAYTFLFKLLCAPGESVLAPVPSYPLFEHLAGLEAVELVPYRLHAALAWRSDTAELDEAPQTTRAVVVVHPNNPTGSPVHPEDGASLVSRCADRGWALIADEVFLDYILEDSGPAPRSFAATSACLTFTLGGLSKSVGLPQLKLAWIVVGGPDAVVDATLERLDYVADAFLSVATPVQLALPSLLAQGRPVREAIRARCRANLHALVAAVGDVPAVSLHRPRGGWSAVLRVPAVMSEEELVLELLERDGVAVHPGYFFDFPGEAWMVLSLLPREHTFNEGVRRLLRRIASRLDARPHASR